MPITSKIHSIKKIKKSVNQFDQKLFTSTWTNPITPNIQNPLFFIPKHPKPSLTISTSKTQVSSPQHFTHTQNQQLGLPCISRPIGIQSHKSSKKKKKTQTASAHYMTKDQLEENPDGITKRKYQIRRGKAVVVGDSTRNGCDCANGYPKPTEARLGLVGSSKRQCIVECNRSSSSEPLEEERSHFSMEIKKQLTVRLCLRTQRLLLCYIYAFLLEVKCEMWNEMEWKKLLFVPFPEIKELYGVV